MKSAKLMQAIYIITLHDVYDKGRQRVAPPSWEAERVHSGIIPLLEKKQDLALEMPKMTRPVGLRKVRK